MGAFIEQLGQQAASNALGGIMGLFMGDIADKRQLRQQEKLQNLQIGGQKQMVDYNMAKQLQMWKDTNYGAQIEQMEKAGLNPALLYGMKGGGGVTTGNPGGGGVSGAEAPKGGGEIQAAMSMGIQSRLLQAQEENIRANTEKTKVETEKTAGVDTQEAQTRILDLTQGIENKKAQQMLTEVQTRINSIEEHIKGQTAKDSIDRVAWETGKALSEMENIERETYIQKATMNAKIDTVRAEMFGAWLKNAMMSAGTANIEANTTRTQKLLPLEMEKLIREGIQTWKSLDIGQQNATTNTNRAAQEAWLNDVQKSTQIPLEILREAVDGILRKPTGRTTREFRNTPKGDYETYREENYY